MAGGDGRQVGAGSKGQERDSPWEAGEGCCFQTHQRTGKQTGFLKALQRVSNSCGVHSSKSCLHFFGEELRLSSWASGAHKPLRDATGLHTAWREAGLRLGGEPITHSPQQDLLQSQLASISGLRCLLRK